MSMDQFERVISRQRTPAPVEQRLPKTVLVQSVAMWLGWGGAALTIFSGLWAQRLGLATTSEEATGMLLRGLPLATVFIGSALYVRWGLLGKFLAARDMFPKAEKQSMRMRWVPYKALVEKYVELLPAPEDDEKPDDKTPTLARATVEKNLRRFDTTTWVKNVTVYLDPDDPERRVLIDDGRFMYAGRILAKGETPPSVARRALILVGFGALVALLAGLEAWYTGGLG